MNHGSLGPKRIQGFQRSCFLLLCVGVVWGYSNGTLPSYLRSQEDQGDSSKHFLAGAVLLVRTVPGAGKRWMLRRVFPKWEGLQHSFMMIKYDIAIKEEMPV